MNLRNLLTLALMLLSTASLWADREVSYARNNQTVTLTVDWTSSNYGTLKWQKSTDGGATWETIANTDGPSCSFKLTGITLCRAIVKGDPSCPDVVVEREVRPVTFNSTVKNTTANGTTVTLMRFSLGEARVKEYGYASLIADIGRDLHAWPRTKVGDALPEGNTVDIPVTGLEPSTHYQIVPYILTEDGSMIFGPEKDVTTKAGIAFDSEDWVIEKTRMTVPFSITGADNPAPKFFLGTDSSSLREYTVTDKGDGHYTATIRSGLTAGTEYLAVVKATVNGQEVERQKTVKTMSDYSTAVVDETEQPISHRIVWDRNRELTNLTPEDDQVEYPRMCRAGDEKIILTYHGGQSDHWQNTYLRKSYDNGTTWSDRVTIYKKGEEFLGSNYWRICNPEMTRLQNGWIILSVVANGNPETNENCKVLVCLSKDDGETWGDPIVVGRGHTWEPMEVQLPTGEFLIMAHTDMTGSVWQTCRPQTIVADSSCKTFKYSNKPLNGNVLPAGTGAYYNSLFLFDDNTVWLLTTRAKYSGSTRDNSDVMILKG